MLEARGAKEMTAPNLVAEAGLEVGLEHHFTSMKFKPLFICKIILCKRHLYSQFI